MKTNLKWIEDYQFNVNDGRGHEVILDLPTDKGGTDLGTSALELCLMSLNGCMGTIFNMMANKLKLTIEALEIEIEATKEPTDPTVTSVAYLMKIKSSADDKKLQKCFELTHQICPVGIIFDRAEIPMKGTWERI